MTDAEQLALARRVDELEAECRALRARLDAAADASAGDDALGGAPEPPPQTAWTEPTGMTANLPPPAITDTEASDGIQDTAPKLRSILPVADEFLYDNTPWPADALTLRGISTYSPSVGPLTLQFNPGSVEPGGIVRYVPSLTTPNSETNAKCLLACKVVNLQTGDARLEWCDATALGAIEVPDVSSGGDYENIVNWYYSLQDMLEDGPPSGMTDPIPLPDPADPGDWMWKDLDFWKLGGDETECYGSAIGDPNQSQVVNLSGRRLVGSGWGSDADFSVGGDLYCSGGVYVDASHYIHVAGDAYAPTNVTIGGVNYTVLAKL